MGTPITCDLGTLGSGSTATVTLIVNQLTPGSAITTVQVSASQTDPNLSNNQSTSTVNITGAAYAPAPVLSSVAPSAILAGSLDTTVTIAGTGFVAGATVQLDEATIQTSFVTPTQLTATVPAASLATLGWHAITVTNPSPGGGVSPAQPLSVYNVLKAGANHILYDPFSRKIFATLGSSTPLGNSIESFTPATGTFTAPVFVGSEPTRMVLSDDGQVLYVLATGDSRIVRYNMLTQQPQFGFDIVNETAAELAMQPASENTLALTGTDPPTAEIVDFSPATQTAVARSSNSGSNSASSPQFLDPADLVVAGPAAQQFGIYAVTSAGIGTTPASYAPGGVGPFKVMQGIAYSTSGSVSNLTTQRLLGTFPFNAGTPSAEAQAALAPDPALARVFYLAAPSGTGYSSSSPTGIVAFDAKLFMPAAFIPLNFASETSTAPIDVIRWGQDGLAALLSSGDVYLLRGAAIVPQLLQTSSPPALSASSPGTLQHGSGNTVLTLTGTNFLPGIAVQWNGSYRTTDWISATQVTVDIPASDLASAGTASVTAANPGSVNSGAIPITIN
jgi:hypothetical protein